MAGEPLPLDDSLPPGGDADDGLEHEDIGAGDEFILEAGGHSIERHLSREQKLRRGLIGVLVVAIAAYWLLGGASSTLSWLASLRASTSQSRVPNNSPPMLKNGAANPDMIPLPPGVTNNLTLKLAPANGADGYVYSCWSGEGINQPIRSPPLRGAVYPGHQGLEAITYPDQYCLRLCRFSPTESEKPVSCWRCGR